MKRARRADERGFTLIESLVACVLVAIVLVGLGPVTLRIARQSSAMTTDSQRAAALAAGIGWVGTQTYDQLATGTTCAALTGSRWSHTRCVTVTVPQTDVKQVTVTVTGTGSAISASATLMRARVGAASKNPFN